MSAADEMDVFFGEVTQQAAHVYVRLRGLPGGGPWSLAGQLRGPFCQGVRTLPLTASLKDLGAGETLLARAVVPDPSTWTPLSPAHYVVTVDLQRGGEVTQRVERRIGIRTLGARGRDLLWEAKRWVMRGICVSEQAIGDLTAWHEHNAVPIVSRPSDDLLEQASAAGVLLCVELGIDTSAADMRQLARVPAVGLVVLPGNREDAADLKALAPNVLFAQAVQVGDCSVADWADVLICDSHQPHDQLREQLAVSDLPLVAARRASQSDSFPARRAACDLLQRDLASIGDFAGYVV